MVASTLAFLLGALLAALAAAPSQAALKAVSPDVDPNTGFPLWYQDRSDETLELCLDPFNCANPAPDSTAPPSIVAGEGDNFPGEAFYWSAEAIMDTPGGRCRLVLALEAAFNNETESPEPGDQLVFNRIRVRCDGLRANSDFTVTHPFGRETFRTNGEGEFSSSRVRADDTGCQATPCDFSLALADPSPTRTFGPFLRWDSSAPAAPAGYIGNPFVEHRITGSPMGTNLFRVEGPGIVGGLTQNLFALEGKINTHSSTPPPPTPAGPAITVTPATLGFGNQKVGTSSLHKVVTVSSTGTGNASIASVAKAGPDAADFTIVGDSCSGASVPHGSSCEVHVTFSPTAAGPRTASLTVATSDAPASSGTVTLGGTGTQPFASVTPLSISYGNQRVGVASDARRVTVKNTGTADLVIASRTLTGANANQWLIDPVGTTCNAATSVAPGASCVIDVRFLPTSTGAKTAALNIRSDASNASVNVSLSGTGVLL